MERVLTVTQQRLARASVASSPSSSLPPAQGLGARGGGRLADSRTGPRFFQGRSLGSSQIPRRRGSIWSLSERTNS